MRKADERDVLLLREDAVEDEGGTEGVVRVRLVIDWTATLRPVLVRFRTLVARGTGVRRGLSGVVVCSGGVEEGVELVPG
jgi:hypothetical protein